MQKKTLCETCKTPSPKCTWKHNFTPVEGWEAEESKVHKYYGQYYNSFKVKKCPLYKKNER